MSRPTQLRDRLWVAAAMAALCIPALAFLLGPGARAAERENRALTAFPAWPTDRQTLAAFPDRVTRYWNDHFGLRDPLIQLYSELLYGVLGKVPERVIIHPSGWLFWRRDDYRGCESMMASPDEVQRQAHALIATARALAARSTRYAVLLVPRRGAMYRREQPAHFCPEAQAIGHQVREAVQRLGGDFPVVDPYPAMLRERDRHLLYHRTDYHWTDHGAYIGYRELIMALQRYYPELRPLPLSAFEERVETLTGGTYATMANLRVEEVDAVRLFLRPGASHARRLSRPPLRKGPWDYERQVVQFETNVEGPSVLVFRNSYGRQLKQWLPEHFPRSTFIWDEPKAVHWRAHPTDLVIEQRSY